MSISIFNFNNYKYFINNFYFHYKLRNLILTIIINYCNKYVNNNMKYQQKS